MRASPGEGRPYIRKSDGRHVVVVRDQGKRRYLYGRSRADVIEKRDEAMGRIRSGLTALPPKLTVGDQLASWLEDRRGKVKSGTWVVYEGQIRVHLGLVKRIPLARLTPADVRRLVRERDSEGCAPATIRQTLVVLRMALRSAVNDGLIGRNVAEAVKGPRIVRRELEVYQGDEPARLIEACRYDELGPLWLLMLGTALRLGEALALRWSDVDLGVGEVSVNATLRPIDKRFRQGGPRLRREQPKTEESAQTVALPGFAAAALQRMWEARNGDPMASGDRLDGGEPLHRAIGVLSPAGERNGQGAAVDHRGARPTARRLTDDARRSAAVRSVASEPRHRGGQVRNIEGLIFTSPRGTPLDPRNVSRDWHALLEGAGLRRVTIHSLRHTAISLVLAEGGTLEDAKRMARHRTIRQTSDTYGHLVRSRQREVAGMLERAVAV